MCAALRGRLECAKALLRSGADPNFQNSNGDLVRSSPTYTYELWYLDALVRRTRARCFPRRLLTFTSSCLLPKVLFWAIDGGVEMTKLMVDVRAASLRKRAASLSATRTRDFRWLPLTRFVGVSSSSPHPVWR